MDVHFYNNHHKLVTLTFQPDVIKMLQKKREKHERSSKVIKTAVFLLGSLSDKTLLGCILGVTVNYIV